MSKLDSPAFSKQRTKQRGYRLALCNRVGGDVGELSFTLLKKLHRLSVPAGYIVQVAIIVLVPNTAHVLCLFLGFGVLPNKRRVTEYQHLTLRLWNNQTPVHGKRVSVVDMSGNRDRQTLGAAPMRCASSLLHWWSTRNIAVSAILAGHQFSSIP